MVHFRVGRVVAFFCVLILLIVHARNAAAASLFGDSFSRANSTNVSASTSGQSGSLAPLTYYQTPDAQIENQQLRLGVGSPSGDFVFPDHNFTDAAITSAG